MVKSAQEYRDERKVEVETEEEMTYEGSTSGEITNPNDELPVTYLFYELQRRYRISERLHRVTPVVLVAPRRAHLKPRVGGSDDPGPGGVERRDLPHAL